MIKENMYMQYFVGLSSFTTNPIFHHTEFAHIRRRLSEVDFNRMTEELMRAAGVIEKPQEQNSDGTKNKDTATSPNADHNETDKTATENVILPAAQNQEAEQKDTPELNKTRLRLSNQLQKRRCEIRFDGG